MTTAKSRSLAIALAAITSVVNAKTESAARPSGEIVLTANDLKLAHETDRLARMGRPPATTVPDPRRKGSAGHRRILADFAAAPEHPVVLFGDSLTDNWRGGKRFALMKEEFAAVNAAICGDRIADILWRLGEMREALAAKPPKIATFMIGTNDLGDSGTEEIAAGMKNLVKVYRGICPSSKVIVFAIPPRAWGHDLRPLPFVAPVNLLYRELADGEDVFFFDFSFLLTDRHGATVLSDLYEADKLHFSDRGYAEVLTPFIGGAIRLVLSPTTPAGYLRRIDRWRDYLEKRRDLALKNHALEELWKNEWFIYELPRTLLGEFGKLKADRIYVPEMPPEYLRQGREEGLPEGF